ncbi:GNAT family N-acetyltransferase [Dyella sp. C11]|uniref:GNAT family N-acetyltransferase n=1 Tax=Dyella sp. C11 TaxID=2126991 RepID=UPI000D650928|nr:GNAT family N-acetyltransferase [Dyella sp. C11]
MSIAIRIADRGDIEHIAQWNTAMAWETEHKALEPAVIHRGVTAVFDEPRRGFYLLAERDKEPVGCLLVTYEWSDWRAGDFWWIQSVYVVESARREGVFRRLYEEAKDRAKQARAVGLRLYVETENERAQRTYAGLGMERCHYFMYEAEF